MPLFRDRRIPLSSDDGSDAGLTLIDADITLVGEIVSEENIRLRGRVEGTVEGRVVVARKFELRPTGRMRGDIRASIVAIAEEGFLQGKVLATEKISTNTRARRLDRG